MSNKSRIAVIGLGGRGGFLLEELLAMPGVEITAVCDIYEDRIEKAIELAKASGHNAPVGFNDYKKLIDSGCAEGVIISTDWNMHIKVALYAMYHGVYAGIEAGGADSLDVCYELVHTYERTGIPCMMLENCCYGRDEMAMLHMIKNGLFGELVHCGCGYLHDLRDEICLGAENRHYRLNNYLTRNCDNYPTHGIGPVSKYLGINNGNRYLSLVSMSSKSRGLKEWVKNNLPADHALNGREFNMGDIVTTMIKCANGETVSILLDTSLPRPYSRNGKVQGTNGIWIEDGRLIHLQGRTQPHCWESFDALLDEFDHPLWKEYQKEGVHERGHGGMDYLILSAFTESVRNKTQTPIDVYDTATWMAVTVLSEQSIALGSTPVYFPDFTNGAWINRSLAVKSKYSLDKVHNDLFNF